MVESNEEKIHDDNEEEEVDDSNVAVVEMKVKRRSSSKAKKTKKRKSKVVHTEDNNNNNNESIASSPSSDLLQGGEDSHTSLDLHGEEEVSPPSSPKKKTVKKKRKSSIKITTTDEELVNESDLEIGSNHNEEKESKKKKKRSSSIAKKKKKTTKSKSTRTLDSAASPSEVVEDESEREGSTLSLDLPSESEDEHDDHEHEEGTKMKKKKKKRKSSIAKSSSKGKLVVDEVDEENNSQSFTIETDDEDGDGHHKKKKKSTTTKKKRKSLIKRKSIKKNQEGEEGRGGGSVDKKDEIKQIEIHNVDDNIEHEGVPTPRKLKEGSELLTKYNEFWSQRGIIEKVKSTNTIGGGSNDSNDGNNVDELNGFLERQSKRVARSPCIHFWTSLIFSIVLGMIGLIVGEFSVSASTGGWQSRGTMVANRQTQFMLADYNQHYLLYGGEDAWKDLIDNVQSGWEDDDDDVDDDNSRRRLHTSFPPIVQEEDSGFTPSWVDYLTPQADRIQFEYSSSPSSASSQVTRYIAHQDRPLPFRLTESLTRRLQQKSNLTDSLTKCDVSIYDPVTLTMSQPRLWPIWKTNKKDVTALSPEAIYDICVAESKTQKYLEENDLCNGCEGFHDDGRRRCLPAYSLVLFARLTVDSDGMDMSCEQLRDAWGPYQAEMEEQLKTCISELKANYEPGSSGADLPESCPDYFATTLVDETYEKTNILKYTSSVFVTNGYPLDDLFDGVDSYDRGGGSVTGAYDTQWEDFVETHVDNSLVSDMALAMGSAVVVALAIVVHTKSLFLTFIGLLQIILSFPLAYFVYKLVIGLDFFPFLNFIGVFVLFALGADDVFVAVDKWKNARIAHPKASTEYVAAVAFPDAAGAMFLTTLTTAIAFFATAICPVAPVKMFAVFVGLLVMFDYLMNVLLVFPALCIYDRALQRSAQTSRRPNCCITWACSHGGSSAGLEDKNSVIHRVLSLFYSGLHSIRWVLFVVCVVAIILSAVFAAKLDLPTSSDVRLLPSDEQFEQNYQWKKHILWSALDRLGGSRAHVIWGVSPADTGIHGDPTSWSQLVLDPSFDPSSEESQIYMTQFCAHLYEQEFAKPRESNYTCPMQAFDLWLQQQSEASDPAEIYIENCNFASGIPVAQEDFHSCIIAWTRQVGETSILSRNGEVKIVFVPFASRVRYDNHYDQLDIEWKLIEKWMDGQNSLAPPGVNAGYFTSFDFWWYDTNGAMLKTAYSSAAIALGAASAVVLFSSRSFVLTIFSTMTIGYVLCSVTATLVSLGWTLGFLESICFAILIGISVDFVIHFGHAYASLPGNAPKGERTKYALINMGPSILAAAFTTMAAAIIMLFCVITFFSKFALILFMTVIQASAGSFVVFLVFTDCIGPSQPTYLVDRALEIISNKMKSDEDSLDKKSLNDETERTAATNITRKLSSFFDV